MLLMMFGSGGGEGSACDFGNDGYISPPIAEDYPFQLLVGADTKDGVAPCRWQVGCEGM